MTWFDLSPMRPDDYYNQEGHRWQTLIAYRNAYAEGVKRANDEAAEIRELERDDF